MSEKCSTRDSAGKMRLAVPLIKMYFLHYMTSNKAKMVQLMYILDIMYRVEIQLNDQG